MIAAICDIKSFTETLFLHTSSEGLSETQEGDRPCWLPYSMSQSAKFYLWARWYMSGRFHFINYFSVPCFSHQDDALPTPSRCSWRQWRWEWRLRTEAIRRASWRSGRGRCPGRGLRNCEFFVFFLWHVFYFCLPCSHNRCSLIGLSFPLLQSHAQPFLHHPSASHVLPRHVSLIVMIFDAWYLSYTIIVGVSNFVW